MAEFKAVLFDWRGTLVRTLPETEWIKLGLERAGRPGSDATVAETLARIEAVPDVARLWGPGIDADPHLHRATFLSVFAAAGLDSKLAEALYEVESDPSHNPFADDVVCSR